jgi:hypothetical protein
MIGRGRETEVRPYDGSENGADEKGTEEKVDISGWTVHNCKYTNFSLPL